MVEGFFYWLFSQHTCVWCGKIVWKHVFFSSADPWHKKCEDKYTCTDTWKL